ncbi:MAG: DUF2178 domain-containing protein [Nanoarchaeota archaeon]|nr:DUF2178 domain-containing protein [Nanoarchaeota archaeon]
MKKIKYKQYRFYKLLIVLVLAAIVGASVSAGNFVLPLALFLVALILMFVLRKKVDEVLVDERVNKIAGRASRIVLSVSVVIMALSGMVLIAIRESYPEYLITGYVFSYFACGMLFLYVILFKYYFSKKI